MKEDFWEAIRGKLEDVLRGDAELEDLKKLEVLVRTAKNLPTKSGEEPDRTGGVGDVDTEDLMRELRNGGGDD